MSSTKCHTCRTGVTSTQFFTSHTNSVSSTYCSRLCREKDVVTGKCSGCTKSLRGEYFYVDVSRQEAYVFCSIQCMMDKLCPTCWSLGVDEEIGYCNASCYVLRASNEPISNMEQRSLIANITCSSPVTRRASFYRSRCSGVGDKCSVCLLPSLPQFSDAGRQLNYCSKNCKHANCCATCGDVLSTTMRFKHPSTHLDPNEDAYKYQPVECQQCSEKRIQNPEALLERLKELKLVETLLQQRKTEYVTSILKSVTTTDNTLALLKERYDDVKL